MKKIWVKSKKSLVDSEKKFEPNLKKSLVDSQKLIGN
jgi:hypothetical protein